MRINVKAKNTQVTEPLTDYINKRFSKLEKYFVDADLAGTVTLIVEKGIHRVEATIPLNRYILRAEENSNDMYASIDGVVDKLERQIRKYKTKASQYIL
jgi:putative sigma-54 modulation protein